MVFKFIFLENYYSGCRGCKRHVLINKDNVYRRRCISCVSFNNLNKKIASCRISHYSLGRRSTFILILTHTLKLDNSLEIMWSRARESESTVHCTSIVVAMTLLLALREGRSRIYRVQSDERARSNA